MVETVVKRCSVKKVFLEISQNSQKNTSARFSFLIKRQVAGCNFIEKETLALVFFCEFCEISKNTFFHRTPLVAVSKMVTKSRNLECRACLETSLCLTKVDGNWSAGKC